MTNDVILYSSCRAEDQGKKSRRVPITAPPTMTATTTTTTAVQTTMKLVLTERSAFSTTTTAVREISAAPVYESSNDDQERLKYL